ncbi:MAG: type II toxin-antitoxin system death-on-curing family toxin [Rhodospirillales bacterium]
MTPEPEWLEREVVTAAHGASIARFGGSDGLRDEGLLESALERARNRFAYDPDATIFDLAAAYGYGLARNHPFVDGNKRTALIAMAAFVELNGHKMRADPVEEYKTILALAAGKLEEAELAAWLAANCAPLDAAPPCP